MNVLVSCRIMTYHEKNVFDVVILHLELDYLKEDEYFRPCAIKSCCIMTIHKENGLVQQIFI